MRKSWNSAAVVALCFLASLHFQASASGTPQWTTPVPLAEVNLDEAEEWSPFLSFDGLTLYFARVRGPESSYGRLFQATRSEPWGPFTAVEKVPGTINRSDGHVLYPWVSPDDLRMYYYEQIGSRYLLRVTEREWTGAGWPQGRKIYELNALGDHVMMPRLTADELTLVFCSDDVAGGQGGFDLWIAERTHRDARFTSVQNIEAVNTPSGELGPYISPDGRQLYFSSYRHGKKQLFIAKRASRDDPFGEPVCLPGFDMPDGHNAQPSLSHDGTELYFQLQTGEDRWARDIYVSYAAPGYYVDAMTGDDTNSGAGPLVPFATIQRAIDVAADGDVINVCPGVYSEEIGFQGKAITVQGIGGAPILEAPGGFAASFSLGEGPDTVLRNFVIRNSHVAVLVLDSSPTLTNLTIVGNELGIEAYRDAAPAVSNCILWDNAASDLYGCAATYSCIERETLGKGNFSDDPLFFDAANGDYHLRSERGRYWPVHDVWVLDDVTSPCIDAGDPNADFGDERQPNGGRVNLGAYGNTPQASCSPDQPSDRILTAGCLSYWSFNEGAGTLAVDSCGGRRGDVHGAEWVSGPLGTALWFDGSDDYVALPDNEPVWLPREDFSIAFWVYFGRAAVGSVADNEVLLDLNYAASSDREMELGCSITRRGDTGKIVFSLTTQSNTDDNLYSSEPLSSRQWHHIAAVREGGLQRLFLDGILSSQRHCTDTPVDYSGGYDDDKVNLGRFTSAVGSPRYYFRGGLDELVIMDRALSETEVALLYREPEILAGY